MKSVSFVGLLLLTLLGVVSALPVEGVSDAKVYDRSDISKRDFELAERASYSKKTLVPEPPCPVAKELAKRLLLHPTNYTNISQREWTAIDTSIYLLQDRFKKQGKKTQAAFHDVCTGELDPQAFGFDHKVFSRLCHPEISVPVGLNITRQAGRRIGSVKWAMYFLHKNEDDKAQACGNLGKISTSVPVSLDKPYLSKLLCKKKKTT